MKEDDHHYIPSDKGGEMVIMTSSHYNSLATDHLSDNATYERITSDPTNSQELKINALWKTASSKATLPSSLQKKLVTRHSKIAQFYHLPKTHKLELAIRPIVSSINSPCEKMAWLLHPGLAAWPLLAEVPAHLENTHQLLTKLKSIPQEQLVSLDVVSLYTNINAQEAITITKELLENKYRSKTV